MEGADSEGGRGQDVKWIEKNLSGQKQKQKIGCFYSKVSFSTKVLLLFLLAYTIAKYGMSMCVLGMAEEFRGEIAVNALWPRTGLYLNHLTGFASLLRTLLKPSDLVMWGELSVSELVPSLITDSCEASQATWVLGNKANCLLCTVAALLSPRLYLD